MKTRTTLALLLSGLLTACNAAGPTGAASDPPSASATSAADAGLERRAREFWAARLAEDWETVLKFEEPARRETIDPREFREWSEKNEPFKVHAYTIGRVQTDRDMGWVELTHRSSVRRFPEVPPRETRTWEKWALIDGDWYPVPAQFSSSYPEAPAIRDAAAEAVLRERFEESWAARQAHDADAFLSFFDPRDRDRIDRKNFVESLTTYLWISSEVAWVEAVADRGRVSVVITRRPNDPSLAKMAPIATRHPERWVRYEGQWYLDAFPSQE